MTGKPETNSSLKLALMGALPPHFDGGAREDSEAKKAAPLLGPRFKEVKVVGDVRKGCASYRSASRYGTSGNVE
jgi:hypothetical protein